MTVTKRKRLVFFRVRIDLVCFISTAAFPNGSRDLIMTSFCLKASVLL